MHVENVTGESMPTPNQRDYFTALTPGSGWLDRLFSGAEYLAMVQTDRLK